MIRLYQSLTNAGTTHSPSPQLGTRQAAPMNHCKTPWTAQRPAGGFSLLELVTVFAGITILAALGIPNVINYLNYVRVKEAKATLNLAAAECLQLARNAPSGTPITSLTPTSSLQQVR